ncbi:glucosamine-6-phosphate deaminase [Bacillus chungangensis]|uniref:Glucosamine-6-phosphate deaminase n=1 Tax=Bacillus chungangensis TaxID=587633 RepID=A0ABT9WV46_9BACI|nr:glucosamine-6-phosphate deaminase [Bacillus chungangensis]MDQ0177174.1 glucosamine-6-phosphate deaminase [Bacillus chungangensis]
METIIVNNPEEGAEKAFQLIKTAIQANEVKTLGLATGSTPLKLYDKMAHAALDVSEITTVNLDEYVGLAKDDPNSYHYYMNENLFSKVHFKETHLPNGMAENLEEECANYEALLQANPVDIQILGIGTNGHIGFNEPGTSFSSKTDVVELAAATREANKRFFEKEEDVPTHAISMGIQSIMAAKKIILLAFGAEKAEAIKQTVEGAVNVDCPASVLQQHPNAIIITDKDAASLLTGVSSR